VGGTWEKLLLLKRPRNHNAMPHCPYSAVVAMSQLTLVKHFIARAKHFEVWLRDLGFHLYKRHDGGVHGDIIREEVP
jgi:hypothetical protein